MQFELQYLGKSCIQTIGQDRKGGGGRSKEYQMESIALLSSPFPVSPNSATPNLYSVPPGPL